MKKLFNLFQLTEEKLGKAERTENDPQFEILAKRTDKIKSYTEKLVKDGEAVLVPNPGKSLVKKTSLKLSN
jgi:endophilin-B